MTTRHGAGAGQRSWPDHSTLGSRSRPVLPAGRQMLVRTRLLDRLRVRWSVPVTVVVAPAGYGKTTLLRQALPLGVTGPTGPTEPTGSTGPTEPTGIDRWSACPPGATSVQALGEVLCRAVDARVPGGGGGDLADRVVVALQEAIGRRSPRPVCLFIDDVDEVRPGTPAARLLAAVVGSLPANGHVVLAGRMPPPVSLEGPVASLGPTELAFTDEELAAFADLRDVPADRVAGCGGWPALAELSAGGRSELVREYVEQEVLRPISPARRRALALLAHVGRFDAALARTALGPEIATGAETEMDVPALLEGLPLVTAPSAAPAAPDLAGTSGGTAPADAAPAPGPAAAPAPTAAPNPDTGPGMGREWALHPLWRSLLAGTVPADELAAAQRRGATHLRQHDRPADAVPLLLEAGPADELGRAVVEALAAPRPAASRTLLASWHASLPPEVRTGPIGSLLAAVTSVDTDPQVAAQRLEVCAATFREIGDATGELASLVHLGELAWWAEDTEVVARVARRVIELHDAGCRAARSLAAVSPIVLASVQGDRSRVQAELDRAPADEPLEHRWPGITRGYRAISLLQLGKVEDALAEADRALAHADPIHVPLIEATRLHALSCQGRIAEVVAALPGVLRRSEASGYRHAATLVAAHGCLTHAFLGEVEQATDYLARARAYVASTGTPMIHTAVVVAEAALAVAEADEAAAAAKLTAELARHPLDQGLPAAAQWRSLALVYVLVPAARPPMDRAELGPALATARDLARAVVEVREQGELPAQHPPLPAATVVRAHLPQRWMAELGTAALAAGRDDGLDLLEASWPATRTVVTRLADRAGVPLRRAARTTLRRLAAPPSVPLELRLLGPLDLRRDGVPIHSSEWRRERVRSLLAYLALYGTVHRDVLGQDLWPGLDAERQDRNLRVNLSYLLRVLEPDRPRRGASYFVRQRGHEVALHTGEWLTIDVRDFDATCRRAEEADRRGAPSEALALALDAVALWRGDPTALASESWAVAPLEERRVRFARMATRAAQLLLARGSGDRARVLAEQALGVDPWMEAAHRVVVASHQAVDDNLAVRRALDRYREALDELGVSRDQAAALVEQLLDGLPPAPRPAG